ncbi:MAG TPA: hypothetical protein VEL07_19945, partial [Planctomycetota bacterium]|nr:hypothetical protein [Planctomycetota bacterium]
MPFLETLRIEASARHAALAVAIVAAAIFVAPCASGGEAAHPRLLFGSSAIPGLRQKITIEPVAAMYRRLVADTTAPSASPEIDPGIRDDGPWAEGSAAARCGFLYVLTGDDEWAKRAKVFVERRINDVTEGTSGTGWAKNVKGLRLYHFGKSVALAYDFCWSAPSWSQFRITVSTKLKEQADFIF